MAEWERKREALIAVTHQVYGVFGKMLLSIRVGDWDALRFCLGVAYASASSGGHSVDAHTQGQS